METDKILGLKIQYELDNISELKEISFSNLPEWKTVGIYYLFDENKDLIYIGKSTNSIYCRLRNHLFDEEPHPNNRLANKLGLYKRGFYKYLAYSEVPRDYIESVEILLIKKFNPRFNRANNKEYKLITLKPTEYEILQQEKLNSIYYNL